MDPTKAIRLAMMVAKGVSSVTDKPLFKKDGGEVESNNSWSGKRIWDAADEIANHAKESGYQMADGPPVKRSKTNFGHSAYVPITVWKGKKYFSPNIRVSDHGVGVLRHSDHVHVQSEQDVDAIKKWLPVAREAFLTGTPIPQIDRKYSTGGEVDSGEKINLHRASDDSSVNSGTSFSEDHKVAKHYQLHNSGFGGSKLYSISIPKGKVLDITSGNPWKALSNHSGIEVNPHEYDHYIDRVFPTENHGIAESLEAKGFDWVRLNESYPSNSITWQPVSSKAMWDAEQAMDEHDEIHKSNGGEVDADLKTAKRLGMDTSSIPEIRKARELSNFHNSLGAQVNERAMEHAQRAQEYHESGKLPMPVGTRFHTEHSRKNDMRPWTVVGHYVDSKNPEKYGYFAERGKPDDEDWSSGVLLASDPKADERFAQRGHPPIDRNFQALGSLSVAKADGGEVEADSIPAAPGTTPIKEGHVRLYHQTDGDSLREIEKHGLLLKHAKGIEGPRAIYAGETPFYGDALHRPTLEFQVPKDQWQPPFVLRDVKPEDFIAAHYPWHKHARYLEKNNMIANVLSGKFDNVGEDEDKAVNYLKRKYAVKKATGGIVHKDKGGEVIDNTKSKDWVPHPENDLLQPIGSSKMVGGEKIISDGNDFKSGLSTFPAYKKSYRYLYHDEKNTPVGAMQIMTDGPRSKKAVIQNLYVAEKNRREGIASKLLKRAREDFDVRHSTDLTSMGKSFAKAVKKDGGRVESLARGGAIAQIPDEAFKNMIDPQKAIRRALMVARSARGTGGVNMPPSLMPSEQPQEQPANAYFEVAPGKTWHPEMQASWEQLHPQAKAAISHKMVGEFLSRWQRKTGIQGEVRPGIGGFEGYTNPNFTFHPYNPEHISPALHGLGELFSQDAMMGAHKDPFKGSFPSGVVRINLPKGMSQDEAHEVYKILHGNGLAEGHTTNLNQGTMDILSGSGGDDTKHVATQIDKALESKYPVSSYPAHIAFPSHGENYGLPRSQVSESSGTSVSHPNDSLQAEASARLKDLLAEAHRQGGGHQGKVSFGDTLAPGQPHPDTVSAAMPTTVSAYKGPPIQGTSRTDISPSLHSEENRNAIATRMWKQHPASGGEELPGPEAAEKLLNFHVKNLLALWDRTPLTQRKTSRYWYRAAHALGNAYAEEHGVIPRASHAIMAVLSPQNPWDNNVTQAERVMDTLRNRLDQPWTKGMTDTYMSGGSKGEGLPFDKGTKATGPHLWSDIKNKTLREVLNGPHGQQRGAMWIRAFDEAHNPTEYRSVSPTGEFLGTMLNKSGTAPDTASWNSYSPIAKAISIWHDPSLENINKQIGGNHKVREFYNTITNPHDPNAVVSDTHAVAAGDMLPHGSSAKAVHHNFGTVPEKKAQEKLAASGTPWLKEEGDVSRSTGSTGASGDYPFHAEAVRSAAWQRGVHPSEMQSVTWETVRTIFKNKSKPVQKAARDIWSQYAKGEMDHDQAIDAIIHMATDGKGLQKPAWGAQAGQGIGNVTTGSYKKPGVISSDQPAVIRYAKNKPEQESTGGIVDHALRLVSHLSRR